MSKVDRMIEDSLGKEVKVRISSNTIVRGVIEEIEFIGFKKLYFLKQKHGIFKVTMICGVSKTTRSFLSYKLPSAYDDIGEIPEVLSGDFE